MAIKRGDNFKGFAMRVGIVHTASELEAFDTLGPSARQALRDSPIKWLATAIVLQIREAEEQYRQKLPEHMREGFYLDLQNPDLDRNIARGLMQQSVQQLLKDRSPEDAELGIKPLRRRDESSQVRRANYRGR